MLNWMRDLNFVKLERFLLCLALVFPSIVLLTGSHPTCALFETHPHIKQIGMEFTTDVDYMSLDHAYDFLWDELSLREKGGGMIRSKENSNGGEERIAQITMFHQLHCLSALRKALQNSHEGKDIGLNQHDDAHWPHCMDYLRQSIVCSADATLEHSHIKVLGNGSLHKQIDGTGVTRQCQDSNPLFDLAKSKRAYSD